MTATMGLAPNSDLAKADTPVRHTAHSQSYNSQTHQPLHLELPMNPSDFDSKSGLETSIFEVLLGSWQQLIGNIKTSYINTTDALIDEVYITLSQQQINDALAKFVTHNVGMILNLRMDLHQDWLRLYCTVNFKGIFASVYSDFRLVDMTLTAEVQRLVLEQISNTHIIELHSQKWWQVPAAKSAINMYRTVMRTDPLPFLLSKILIKKEPFATHKGNFIYLDIHRYLAKQTKILKTLKKVQVNHGETRDHQLILKAQLNPAEFMNFGTSGEDIITDKDNPNRQKS
ncbi:MAG: hypothetical protein Q4G13_02585 [Moraxella sp.]|nr:hypothetical protein [Moraxella sp.]